MFIPAAFQLWRVVLAPGQERDWSEGALARLMRGQCDTIEAIALIIKKKKKQCDVIQIIPRINTY